MPNVAGVRYPHGRVLLARTRLAYVHLHNLLHDAKRDRSARVSGYVAIWLPEEFLLLYLQRGEMVNATTFNGRDFATVSLASALARVPLEPEYGEICFHEADDEQLAAMYAAQSTPPDSWPPELRVTDPKVLFSYLMATSFDGMVEIRVQGAMNYLQFTDGAVQRAWLAAGQGGSIVERVTSLFDAESRPGFLVRRWPRPAGLPAQAAPALVQAYRELATALVQRVTDTGRESAVAIAEHARKALLPRHPVLEGFAFTGKPLREPVADTVELTAAVASWVQEFMWAAADHQTTSPEQLLKDVMWERRHMFQSSGLLDRIPWKVA
ncbi:MAG: hypothetical protein ACYC4J_08895 [Gemmatimonadaceae bacterium]